MPLARLRLIRRLQAEHLPLAEIRRRLETLDDEAVERLLASGSGPGGSAPTSAVDYVRAILGGPPPGGPPAQPRPPLRPRPSAPPSSSPGSGRPARTAVDRAQWERITLTADIELHVRRPLSREDNRRLEKLLESARDLFRGEEV